MPRIILLLLFLLIMAYAIYRYKRMSPDEKRRALKWFLIVGIGGALVVMVATGRLSWLFAALGALVAVVPRLVRMALSFGPTLMPFLKRYQQNKQSNMQTDFVKLQINMLTGEFQGEVLKGEFAGRKLQQMNEAELKQLLALFEGEDRESAALLAAYLNNVHPEWSHAGTNSDDYAYQSSSDMPVQEARDILGVEETASSDEINMAHKRLMQKMHPDRGGSDYLAQQINRARDCLLKNMA